MHSSLPILLLKQYFVIILLLAISVTILLYIIVSTVAKCIPWWRSHPSEEGTLGHQRVSAALSPVPCW